MADRDLRKMNRKELLELLIVSEKENEQLKERLQQQEAQLRNRDFQIKNSGSMAEAALALSGVFENADKAATQYLENIKRCSEQQQSIYDRIVTEAERKAKAILDNAESEKQKRIKEADAYWLNLSTKLEAFYQAHLGLKELISLQPRKSSETDEKRYKN